MKIKNITAFAAAAVMLTASVSCGSKESSSSGGSISKSDGNMIASPDDDMNVSAGDMSEGSSTILMSESTSGVPMKLEYISSQISEEEGILISKYFYSITSRDGGLFGECFYPGSMENLISRELIGNSQEYADNFYEFYKQYINEDYEFNYLIADGLDDSVDFSYYDDIIKDYAPDAKIESRKSVVMDVYFKTLGEESSNGSMSYRMEKMIDIVIYKIDGQCYIMG